MATSSLTRDAVRSFARPNETPVRETSFLQPREGWLSILLLFAMVGSTVWSIDQAKWVEGTGMLFPLALAGIVVGYLLARSKMAGWIGVLVGLLAGMALGFVVVGQLLPAPGEMLASLGQTFTGSLAWLGNRNGPIPL